MTMCIDCGVMMQVVSTLAWIPLFEVQQTLRMMERLRRVVIAVGLPVVVLP